MAYKQTPGRGNGMKTGGGIPPTLMSGSAMYQKKDIELTVEYDKGKEKMAAARSNPETKAGFEKQQGIKIDAPTGKATANLPMHTVEKAGSFLREYDSKRNVVKEVPWNSMSEKGGKAAEELTRAVAIRNADVTSRQNRNADLYNATGGGTAPDKLSEKQKESLVKLGKAKEVPAQQKKSPAKMKVSKKTAYDIKEASNQKLKPGARKHYAENAQAAMKNKKSPAKQMSKLKKKC